MRPSWLLSRLLPISMVAFAAAGCMQTAFVPDSAAVSQPGLNVPPNLDSMAYERRGVLPPPAASYVPPQPQTPQPQPRQVASPDAAALQAHAQAPVIPVVAQREPPYVLDTGDKLRIVVFGQEGLSNSYFVDAAGQVTIPLIGGVTARGLTTQALSRAIATKLRAGFIREPHVATEIETYRPFFILGEVLQPGQYPYVPNMTVETAVAIAGGFTPRAYRYEVNIDRPTPGGTARGRSSVPLLTQVRPGDTIVIKERWF